MVLLFIPVWNSLDMDFNGWAPQQSNNPMANVGPKGSKSPCDTLTAFHSDKHKVVMINAYGKPLAKLAVWNHKGKKIDFLNKLVLFWIKRLYYILCIRLLVVH